MRSESLSTFFLVARASLWRPGRVSFFILCSVVGTDLPSRGLKNYITFWGTSQQRAKQVPRPSPLDNHILSASGCSTLNLAMGRRSLLPSLGPPNSPCREASWPQKGACVPWAARGCGAPRASCSPHAWGGGWRGASLLPGASSLCICHILTPGTCQEHRLGSRAGRWQVRAEGAVSRPQFSPALLCPLSLTQVYVSYDYGKSFKRISEKLSFGVGNNSEAVIAQFYHSPADNKRVRGRRPAGRNFMGLNWGMTAVLRVRGRAGRRSSFSSSRV